MNENALYKRNEVEINLGNLFWSVLRHWRGIIVFMLVFGVLLGGYSFIKEYKAYTDPAALARRQNEYNLALDQYNRKKEKLQRDIKSGEEYQLRLEDYKERCIYLRMDPYNLYKIGVTFFVDSHYEIDPSLSYQNVDNTAALIKSYRAAIQRIDFETVIDMNGEDLTLRHPVSKFSDKSVYTLTVEENVGLMQLMVTADTKERAEKIYGHIKSVIEDTKKLLTEAIGEHEVSMVNETARYTVDWDYETLQTSFTDDYYVKNQTKTDDLKKQLDALSAPANTVPSTRSAIKAGIKRGVIGLIIGLVAAAVVFIARYVLQDRVYNLDDIRKRYKLPVLGVISLGASRKKLVWPDRKIASRLGIPEGLSPEQSAEFIASNIKLYLKDAGRVLLTGSAGSDAAELLKEKLQPLLPGMEIVSSGDLNHVPAAVDALSSDTAIVCVESWQKTRHLDIVHELDRISATDNKGVGFVVVY
ncbi:MAG: hypothetical protein IJM39_02960 [Firmicutes bacterium]|nr:hypothetical protein [Bacillota bacterium]